MKAPVTKAAMRLSTEAASSALYSRLSSRAKVSPGMVPKSGFHALYRLKETDESNFNRFYLLNKNILKLSF